MNKISKLQIILVLLLALVVLIGCVQLSANSENPHPDTIITEENVYDILEYYGVEPWGEPIIIEGKVTVREYEEALEQIRQLPDKIDNTHSINGTSDVYKEPKENSDDTFYEKEVALTLSKEQFYSHPDDDIDLKYIIQYTGVGKAFITDTGNSYWIKGLGGDVDVLTNWPGMTLKLKINRLQISVKNPKTSDSYLEMKASYTVKQYSKGIPINEMNIQDTITWDTSYLAK